MCTIAGLPLGPLPGPFPTGLPAEGLLVLFAPLPLAAFLRDMSGELGWILPWSNPSSKSTQQPSRSTTPPTTITTTTTGTKSRQMSKRKQIFQKLTRWKKERSSVWQVCGAAPRTHVSVGGCRELLPAPEGKKRCSQDRVSAKALRSQQADVMWHQTPP